MSTLQANTIRAMKAWPHRLSAVYSAWAVPLGVAAVWVLLIWFVHRESPRTLVSFHGLLHAAIVGQFLDGDGVSFPPENPFYAGEPVAYYWFFHLLAAQLVRLFNINVFYAMEMLILFAAAILSVVAIALGRKLYSSTLAGVLIGYLIMAGTNPLGILFALYKVARGGAQVLEDDPNYLWGVVHPIYSAIRFNDIGGLYGPLMNFFLNMTSRPASLAALLLAIFCLYNALTRRRIASWVLFGLAFALTTALSPIIGIPAGGALGLGLVYTWLRGRRASGGGAPRIEAATVMAAGLAIVSGILMAAPTYYHLIFGPSSSGVQFWLFSANGLRNLLTVTLSILPLMALALWGMRSAPQQQKQFLIVLFASALTLLALTVSFSLPASNNSNMFHAAAVLLAAPAAGAILSPGAGMDSRAYSKRRAVVIVLVFLPTLLTLLAAYVLRPPVPASFEGTYLERLPEDSDLALLYQWARDDTDPRAVFILDPRNRDAMCGNTSEFPAITGRAIFTEHFRHYLAEPYPDSRMRFDMAVRLVSGEPPSPSDHEQLSKLNRPIYLVTKTSGDRGLTDRLQSFYTSPVFRKGEIAVFKLQPQG
jgi:hypothetical protein